RPIPANALAVLDGDGHATRWTLLRERPAAAGYAAGSIWAATGTGTLWRIDPASGGSVPYAVGAYPTGVASGSGSVWVTNSSDGTVSRIDPRTGHVDTITVG